MKKIYLYLDESGNFASDSSMRDNPSLVGGYLKYDTPMDTEDAKEICHGHPIHSCEMPRGEFACLAISILQDMQMRGCCLVVFENKERLEIVDGDTTYLNIISEGVVQLMHLMKSRFGSVEFNLIIAQRVAVNRPEYKYRSNGYYISWDEYKKRIQEKIIIGASKTTTNFNIKNWNIEFSDGNTDFRLMLADVVCHSRFRQNKKFDQGQREILMDLYDVDFIFSVFPAELDTAIRRSLVKGNIADAIFEFLVADNKLVSPKYLREIGNSLELINEASRDMHYKMLFSRIINLLNTENEIQLVQLIIIKIRKYLIPHPMFKNLIPISFKMDISLLSLTVATHEGDIEKANTEVEYCLTLLPSLTRRWESLDYYFIFKIRYAVHLINMYDIQKCIDEMNELESVIDNTFMLFPLADGLSELCRDIKSDIKGKMYGNRLQARLNLMKSDTTQYEFAIADSDRAIKEFSRIYDLRRQYQYRCRIEYEAGNCQSAFDWLKKSIFINEPCDDINLLIAISIGGDKLQAAFTLMHLFSIMLLAYEQKENIIFESIWSACMHNKIDKYIENTCTMTHPYEILYWKLGKLAYLKGSNTAGEGKMNRALKICDVSKDNQSLKAIGLGILADKTYILSSDFSKNKKNYDSALSSLCSEYEAFMKMELPESMKEHFSKWREHIIRLKNSKTPQNHSILKKLSNQVYF